MARIRSDLQIERGIPAGNKVLAKPDGQTEVVQIEPYKVSPTTWIVDEAGIYENVPGQFEIPSLPYAKDVDTVISTGGKVYKYNSSGGYFDLVLEGLQDNLFTDDLMLGSSRTHDLGNNTLRFDNGSLQIFGDTFQFYNDLGSYVVDIQLATDQIYFYIYHKSTYMPIGFIVNSSGITFYDGQNSPGNKKNVFLNHVGGRRGEWKPLTIPEYASDTDADNDTDLVSGAPYSLTGDRTVYRKP